MPEEQAAEELTQMVAEQISTQGVAGAAGPSPAAPARFSARGLASRLREALPALSMVALLGYLVLPLLVVVVIRSLQGQNAAGQAAGFTFDNYRSLVDSGQLGQILSNTVILTVVACLTTTIVGGGLAWLAERTNAVGARVCKIAMLASFAFPLLLFAYSWTLLWGQYGPVFTTLKACCGITKPFFSATSLPSLAVAMGMLLTPFGFFMFSAALRRRDVSQEEAAQVAGVRRLRILLSITLPSLRPAFVGVTLLVAILTMQAFDLPAILGLPGRVPVLTTGIFTALVADFPANYGEGSAFAVILVGIVSILLAVSRRFLKETSAYAVISNRGSSYSEKRIDLGHWRWLGILPFGIFTLFGVVAPIGLAVWTSFLPYYKNPTFGALRRAGWHNYATVFARSNLSSAIWNTVILCLVVSTVGTVLAGVAAWLSLRRSGLSGRLIRQLAMLPLVFPGIVLGLAVGSLYVYYPGPLYGSIWLLAIAYITLFFPLAFTYSFSGVSQISRELEESASVAGVPHRRILRSVVFPLAGPSLAASWVLLFLLASKDVGIPILLSRPNSLVLSMSILNEGEDGAVPVGFALATVSTLISLVVIAVVFLGYRLAKRRR